MKYIQSIFAICLLAFGLAACSVNEIEETSRNDSANTIRLIPAARPAYGSTTRVTTDGANWSEGDVVFVRVTFFADDAMADQISFLYTAMRFGADGNWVAATGTTDGGAKSDFTFKTVDAEANADLWSTNNVIPWPANGAKRAMIHALYAGKNPVVELLKGGNARVNVNAARVGTSEILTYSQLLTQADLSAPVKLIFGHRLTRLDFGKELSDPIQLKSGSFGSGVSIIPLSIDFGLIITSDNTAEIPAGQQYIFIAPDKMAVGGNENLIFRFLEPASAAVVAAFSLPKIPMDQTSSGFTYYFGQSYVLGPQVGGGVNPDDMLPVVAP